MNRATLAIAGVVLPATIATVLLTTGAARPLDSPPKSVSLAGTPWYSDLSVATKIAEREKKPLLILQMMGRLDDAFC